MVFRFLKKLNSKICGFFINFLINKIWQKRDLKIRENLVNSFKIYKKISVNLKIREFLFPVSPKTERDPITSFETKVFIAIQKKENTKTFYVNNSVFSERKAISLKIFLNSS